jgi:hypothetical protein
VKKNIQGSEFTFKDAKVPRSRPSRRLQALIGEQSSNDLQPTAKSNNRITTYYQTLDKALLEMKSPFESNDQDILCALADVLFNSVPSDKNLALVSSFYTLDIDILKGEKNVFQNFPIKDAAKMKNAASVVEKMHQNGLDEVLPVFYRVFSILATIPATSCSA